MGGPGRPNVVVSLDLPRPPTPRETLHALLSNPWGLVGWEAGLRPIETQCEGKSGDRWGSVAALPYSQS